VLCHDSAAGALSVDLPTGSETQAALKAVLEVLEMSGVDEHEPPEVMSPAAAAAAVCRKISAAAAAAGASWSLQQGQQLPHSCPTAAPQLPPPLAAPRCSLAEGLWAARGCSVVLAGPFAVAAGSVAAGFVRHTGPLPVCLSVCLSTPVCVCV
jgi:hypothetical protein